MSLEKEIDNYLDDFSNSIQYNYYETHRNITKYLKDKNVTYTDTHTSLQNAIRKINKDNGVKILITTGDKRDKLFRILMFTKRGIIIDKSKTLEGKEGKKIIKKQETPRTKKEYSANYEKGEECSMCGDKYTKIKRKPITCIDKDCGYKCCIECFESYILNLANPTVIKCPNMLFKNGKLSPCTITYTSNFLLHYIPKTFFNRELASKIGEYYLNIETSLLPSTQDEAVRVKKQRQIADLRYEVRIHNAERRKMKGREERKLKIQIINGLKAEIVRLQAEVDLSSSHEGQPKGKKKKVIKISCCVPDCAGFIDNKYVCEICDTKMCKDCHQVKGEAHECKEEDVENIKYIKQLKCTPCPRCRIDISRIDGCPYMWCTSCNIGFDYNTGEEVTGRNDNPHQNEYMLRNADTNFIVNLEGCGTIGYNFKEGYMRNADMLIDHILHTEMDKYSSRPLPDVNRETRIRYLLKDFDRETWQRKIKTTYKSYNYNLEIRQVLHFLSESLASIVRRAYEERDNKKQYKRVISELKPLRKYINYSLFMICWKYNKKYIYVNRHFRIIDKKLQRRDFSVDHDEEEVILLRDI